MEQTFLNYVLTDARFWAASTLASARSVVVPASLSAVGTSLAVGVGAVPLVCAAMLLFVAADWVLLVLRMARRIAVGVEDPDRLLDRSVVQNASHLYGAYYARRGPRLRAA